MLNERDLAPGGKKSSIKPAFSRQTNKIQGQILEHFQVFQGALQPYSYEESYCK